MLKFLFLHFMIYGLILQLDQISLALPSRDYYLKPNSAGDRQAYHKYMTNIAVLLGANKTTASLELEKVIEFERKLANVRLQLLHNKTSDKIELLQASLPEQDRHDTSLLYRKVRLQELQQIVPQINWLEYFRSFIDVEINANDPVVVYSMSYFVDMGKILAATDKRYDSLQLLLMIQSHLQYNMVESNSSLISQNLKLIYSYLFSRFSGRKIICVFLPVSCIECFCHTEKFSRIEPYQFQRSIQKTHTHSTENLHIEDARDLTEDQWNDRGTWKLDIGQRRKTF